MRARVPRCVDDRPHSEMAVPSRYEAGADYSAIKDNKPMEEAIVAGAASILITATATAPKGRGIVFAAADRISPAVVTFMAVYARGILSVAVDERARSRLGLHPMSGAAVPTGEQPYFLSSVEAAACPGTGISAADRAMTMRTVGNPESTHDSLVSPGHILPALVTDQTASSDSLLLAALRIVEDGTGTDAAAWCDILADNGDLADGLACLSLARRHDLSFAWYAAPCHGSAMVSA